MKPTIEIAFLVASTLLAYTKVVYLEFPSSLYELLLDYVSVILYLCDFFKA